MPLVGYLATRGGMNIAIVTAAGTLGSLVGTLPWYYLGKRLGHVGVRRFAARHARWLTMHPSDVDAASERFKRHGNASVLVGRLIPTVRTLISVPAGVANMPMGRFLLFLPSGRSCGRRRWRWRAICSARPTRRCLTISIRFLQQSWWGSSVSTFIASRLLRRSVSDRIACFSWGGIEHHSPSRRAARRIHFGATDRLGSRTQ